MQAYQVQTCKRNILLDENISRDQNFSGISKTSQLMWMVKHKTNTTSFPIIILCQSPSIVIMQQDALLKKSYRQQTQQKTEHAVKLNRSQNQSNVFRIENRTNSKSTRKLKHKATNLTHILTDHRTLEYLDYLK